MAVILGFSPFRKKNCDGPISDIKDHTQSYPKGNFHAFIVKETVSKGNVNCKNILKLWKINKEMAAILETAAILSVINR